MLRFLAHSSSNDDDNMNDDDNDFHSLTHSLTLLIGLPLQRHHILIRESAYIAFAALCFVCFYYQ